MSHSAFETAAPAPTVAPTADCYATMASPVGELVLTAAGDRLTGCWFATGTGRADPGSLFAAVRLAFQMVGA